MRKRRSRVSVVWAYAPPGEASVVPVEVADQLEIAE
jgi:hypothetical protein